MAATRRSALRTVGLVGRHGWRVPGGDLIHLGGGEGIAVPRARTGRHSKLPLVPKGEWFPEPIRPGERRYVGPRVVHGSTFVSFYRGSWRPNPGHERN